MEFLDVVGSRRSIRWFKTWEPVPRSQVQQILEVVRLTTCPGNLQPWRAVVVYRDELEPQEREELLQAANWQGAHTQAPVWIYFYADPESAVPSAFAEGTYQLIDVGAIPNAYGWSKQRIADAIERGVPTPSGMTAIDELLHGLPAEASASIAYAETVGACAVATLAAVDQGLGTCLHMIAKPSAQERVKQILGVPERCLPVWVQLVGHPAESPQAGGQRPRKEFGELFFDRTWGSPFARDGSVVERLTEQRLLQPAAPLPQRRDELTFLARMYGYPEEQE